MLGKSYVEVFNKDGEFVKFVGDEFTPWKKHLIEIICDYKNDYISDPFVKNVLKKLISNVSELKNTKQELLTKNELIASLENDEESLSNELSNMKIEIDKEKNEIINNRHKDIDNKFITKGGKYILKVAGGNSPKYMKVDKMNVSDCKNALLGVICSFTKLENELVSFGIDILYQTQLKGLSLSNDNILNECEAIIKKYNISNGDSFKDMIQKTIESGDISNIHLGDYIENANILDNMLSSIDTGHIAFNGVHYDNPYKDLENEYDSNYFNELSNNNPELKTDVDNIKSIHENKLTQEEIKKRNQEQEEQNRNRIKKEKIKSIKEQYNKYGSFNILILLISGFVFIICLIVSFIKFSRINVKFSSKFF